MSDLKKWFKVWTVILIDENFSELSNEHLGQWTRLGARIASIGKNGSTRFKTQKSLINFLKVKDINDAKKALNDLPNVHFEGGKNDNGNIIVSFKKWRKYQMDSTGYERVKRHRQKGKDNGTREEKRREDKRREDKTRKEKKKNHKYKTLEEALNDKELKEILLKINPDVNWNSESKKMKVWALNNPTKKDFKKFVSGWIGRAKTDKSKQADSPPYHEELPTAKEMGVEV